MFNVLLLALGLNKVDQPYICVKFVGVFQTYLKIHSCFDTALCDDKPFQIQKQCYQLHIRYLELQPSICAKYRRLRGKFSGKEGSSFTGEEEFFYCIFGLSKNPLGLVDSIHAVQKKGKISILKRRCLICYHKSLKTCCYW